MKEIKGLGERLFGLDQLMRDAKNIVRQQGELAQSFLNVSTTFIFESSLYIFPYRFRIKAEPTTPKTHQFYRICVYLIKNNW